ncbi:MAG: recombinase family protein, partial [Candidatus Wildermuthbacteria bacterium]|nr:recombinase family protein [Candidatus Wildermuthbacteria bacterium]
MPIKNCAIYTRVSTDMQAEKEFSSCESQELKIRSFIESQSDWQVAKIYSDGGYSGATMERPAIQLLLTEMKKEKIDVVLVYKIDRLTRSPKDFYHLIECFEQANIDFISITERFDTSTPAGRLLRNIMLTFSQFERELISERVRDKMLERAKVGLFSGGAAPFGYIRVKKKLVPHPENKKIIQSMFETYIETGSLAAVFRALKEKGVKTKNGNAFPMMKVSRLLQSPIYIGKVFHRGIVYDGIHEPLVSKNVFELAQTIDKTNAKKYTVSKHFLFGGLVKCQHCGTTMSGCYTNKHRKGAVKRYFYYRCTRLNRYTWDACPVKEVSAERLERYCLENLERICVDKSYLENLAFRLNNDFTLGYKKGIEPSGVEPSIFQISPDMLSDALSFFTTSLARTKGIEKNIIAKKCIEKIEYAPDQIS